MKQKIITNLLPTTQTPVDGIETDGRKDDANTKWRLLPEAKRSDQLSEFNNTETILQK